MVPVEYTDVFSVLNAKINNKKNVNKITKINEAYAIYNSTPTDDNKKEVILKILLFYSECLGDYMYSGGKSDKEQNDASIIFEEAIYILRKTNIFEDFNPKKNDSFFGYFHYVALKSRYKAAINKEKIHNSHGGMKFTENQMLLVPRVNRIIRKNNFPSDYNDLQQNQLEIILEELRGLGDYKLYSPERLRRELFEITAMLDSIDKKIGEDETSIIETIADKSESFKTTMDIVAEFADALDILKSVFNENELEIHLVASKFVYLSSNVRDCANASGDDKIKIFNIRKEFYKEIFKNIPTDTDVVGFIDNFIEEHGKFPNEGDLADYLNIKQSKISNLRKKVKKCKE